MLWSGPKQGVAAEVTPGSRGHARRAELLGRAACCAGAALHRVRGVAPSSVGRRQVTPCERTYDASNARLRRLREIRPGARSDDQKRGGKRKLEARPLFGAPAASRGAGRNSLFPRGLEGPPEAGCESRLG